MTRMIDMIRSSSVPASVLRTASRGALALPAAEMLEVLVELADHSLFRDQAQLTLAAWENSSIASVLEDENAPANVVAYFSAPKHVRLSLVPAICRNERIDETQLAALASGGSMDVLTAMLQSERVRQLPRVLAALDANPRLAAEARTLVQQLLANFGPRPESKIPPNDDLLGLGSTGGHGSASAAVSTDSADEEAVRQYEREHAAEIAAEKDKPFEVVLESPDEKDAVAKIVEAAKGGTPVAVEDPEDESRLSVIQRIARMTVGQRVQLALKGSKDERFVLIRDGSKVVSVAVLDSPKVSESEMELFASMKNVQEAVLRAIAGKRKYMKQYSVIRALTNNPKCPMDIALGLLPHLLAKDLVNLSKNKNVGENLRKLAFKLFKEKTEKRKS